MGETHASLGLCVRTFLIQSNFSEQLWYMCGRPDGWLKTGQLLACSGLFKATRVLLVIGLKPLLSFSEFCCILLVSWQPEQGQVQMKQTQALLEQKSQYDKQLYCGMVIEHNIHGS